MNSQVFRCFCQDASLICDFLVHNSYPFTFVPRADAKHCQLPMKMPFITKRRSSSKRKTEKTETTKRKSLSEVTNSPTCKQSSVQFAQTVTVHQALHIRDYTDHEVRACWLDCYEYDNIMDEVNFVVGLHKNKDLCVGENEHPRRGLEMYLNGGILETSKQSVTAVVNEQDVQRRTKKSSSARIESAYTVYTQGSRMQARFNAIADEMTVRDMKRSPITNYTKPSSGMGQTRTGTFLTRVL
jgi:hypothetical protein